MLSARVRMRFIVFTYLFSLFSIVSAPACAGPDFLFHHCDNIAGLGHPERGVFAGGLSEP